MANSVECDSYGFFNGIYGIEHSNWAKFWKDIIPDGVVSNQGDELQVYAKNDGMKVYIKPGSAIVAGHRCWIDSEKSIDIAANSSGDTRIDGIFLRVTYGNYGESHVDIISKQGSIGRTREIGNVYDLILAAVTVSNGATSIAAANVADYRYTFRLSHDENAVVDIDLTESSGSYTGVVKAKNDRIHRETSYALKSLSVYLPATTYLAAFMTEVDFSSASNFTGVKIYQGSSQITPIVIGDALTEVSKRYNILIWRDGSNWWVASKAVTI